MGFLGDRRTKKAVDATLRSFDGDAIDLAALNKLRPEERADGCVRVVEALMDHGATDRLIRDTLAEAFESAPDHWDAWACLAQIEEQSEGRHAQAIAAYEKLLELTSDNDTVRLELACLLLAHDQADRAVELCADFNEPVALEDGFRLGQALFGASKLEQAIEVLGVALKQCDHALRTASLVDDFEDLKELHQEISHLHDEAYAEVHGREATVVAHAEHATLDANEGVNFMLLGESLMVESPALAHSLDLQLPEQENEAAQRLIAEGKQAHGQVLLGSSLLRQGQADKAERAFRSACEADGQNFAAFLGLGAAMDAARYRSAKRAERLPDAHGFAHIDEVVPDYRALNTLEQRVVDTSIYPLRSCLEVLSESGVKIRLLPIDVRPTDLPEFSEANQERTEDHRTLEAIGGAASHQFACARVIDLLNIDADNGWTFAHEFAHLAFFHMADELREYIDQLYQQALEVGYVVTNYAASNIDEFVAGTYEDYLKQQNGCRTATELDEHGIKAGMFGLYQELGQTAGAD